MHYRRAQRSQPHQRILHRRFPHDPDLRKHVPRNPRRHIQLQMPEPFAGATRAGVRSVTGHQRADEVRRPFNRMAVFPHQFHHVRAFEGKPEARGAVQLSTVPFVWRRAANCAKFPAVRRKLRRRVDHSAVPF